jgi:hypothetical protein
MRVLAALTVAFGLMVPAAVAGPDGAGEKKAEAIAKTADANAETAKASDAAATSTKAETSAKPEPSPIESELQQLRGLLDLQAKQIQLQNEQL